MADSRNFHGWAYWRFLCNFMGLSAEDQEAYVLNKIEENFSNYSAWHARTSVLQHLNTERPTLSLAELLAADTNKTESASTTSGDHAHIQLKLRLKQAQRSRLTWNAKVCSGLSWSTSLTAFIV